MCDHEKRKDDLRGKTKNTEDKTEDCGAIEKIKSKESHEGFLFLFLGLFFAFIGAFLIQIKHAVTVHF